MELFCVDNGGQLYISPDVDDWKPLEERGIMAVFDLDDDLDVGIPSIPNQLLYVYFPFDDRPELPDLTRLHHLARLGANLIGDGHKVLSHCGMGHNRSALLAGVILTYLGMEGKDAVTLIRQRRPGALYNKVFAEYIESLTCQDGHVHVIGAPDHNPVKATSPAPKSNSQTSAPAAN